MSELDFSRDGMIARVGVEATDQAIVSLVGELVEDADAGALNVMHAILGEAMGQIWDKDEKTGLWGKVSDAVVVEPATSNVEISTGTAQPVGALATAEIAQVIDLDDARMHRRPISDITEQSLVAAAR